MKQWKEIRHSVLVDGKSKRQVMRETGVHCSTLKKILTHSSPPEFQRKEWAKPKLGAFVDRVQEILVQDLEFPKKQRHTAKRIFEVIKSEGYDGGYTAVKDLVRQLKSNTKEVFVPLIHSPGEAQVDYGHALAKVRGQLQKVSFFVMALPHSDVFFVKSYERECLETFQDGHVEAFKFFGGVPNRISYDNARTSVIEVLGGRERKLTEGFLRLQSHYLFKEHFCRVGRGNEKGVVEGLVKYTRLNFLVPVPEVDSLSELNSYLEQRCREDMSRRLRGKSKTKLELLEEDKNAMRELPFTPFEACRRSTHPVNSLSLVRFDRNDYSVPVSYAYQIVMVKGDCQTVRIFKDNDLIAEHERIWLKEDVSFNPVHYLALIEKKPGALDYARPLSDWDLPDSFNTLRTRLENERQGDGTREFVRILRLLEHHSMENLDRSIKKALEIHALNRDVVAQFLYSDELVEHLSFCLDGREHLKGVEARMPQISIYKELVGRCL